MCPIRTEDGALSSAGLYTEESSLSRLLRKTVSLPRDVSLSRVFSITLALGLFLTCLNHKYPLARNALEYAKGALDVLDRHFDLNAVAHDSAITGGKPILFSVLAVPWVWLTDARTGTLIASALGTAFFIFTVCLALPRVNRKLGIGPEWAPAELILTSFNPLVLYQFWSGYPDAMFSGLVLLAFFLTDITATEPERDTRWHIVGLGIAIIAATYTKLYGAILAIACPLYLVAHARSLASRATYFWQKLALLLVVLGIIAIALLAAKLGRNPLLVLDSGTGYNSDLTNITLERVEGSASMLIFAIVLALNICVFFALSQSSWMVLRSSPVMFAAIYTSGLLTYAGTLYNMRFFLPIFPFIAAVLVAGAKSVKPVLRRIVFGIYGVLSLFLILTFNVATMQQIFQPWISRAYAREPNLGLWLDNLRLPVQMKLKEQIDSVNALLPDGSTLYWSSDYSGASTHGLAYDLGVRRDLHVRYVMEPSNLPAASQSIYLALFTSMLPPAEFWAPPQWATVSALGLGLFRLDPFTVHLASLSGDSVGIGEPVRLRVSIASQGYSVGELSLWEGKTFLQKIDLDQSDFTLPTVSAGRHEYTARARYGGDKVSSSLPAVIYIGTSAIERRASLPGDLIDEYYDGEPIIPKAELPLNRNEKLTGVRFENVTILKDAHIDDAYVRFTAATKSLMPATIEIRAELTPDAVELLPAVNALSQRTLTHASVTWNLQKWSEVGSEDRSPNLASILREVLANPRWQSGGSVLFVMKMSGDPRLVKASNVNEAPLLYIGMH